MGGLLVIYLLRCRLVGGVFRSEFGMCLCRSDHIFQKQHMLQQKQLQCRSGLMVACLTAVWEDPGSNLTTVVYHGSHSCDIHSLWHGLHTLTAVPRSTQPSTLCGTVKWVVSAALGLSNNKWRWWMRTVAAISFWRTRSPCQLAWSEGWRPPRRWVCIRLMNRVIIIIIFWPTGTSFPGA